MRVGVFLGALATFGALLVSPHAPAFAHDPVYVRVGEVSAKAPDDAKLMRTSLETTLAGLTSLANPALHPPKKRLVLSAALLACDERRCTISATLREEAGGKVVAMVRGSASSAAPVAREGLLKTAAEGAAKQVPKAFEQP